jgi:hypothetical protein
MVGVARTQIEDADALLPFLALGDDQVMLEAVYLLQLHGGTVRDELGPVFPSRIVDGSFEHPEVERFFVAQDEE